MPKSKHRKKQPRTGASEAQGTSAALTTPEAASQGAERTEKPKKSSVSPVQFIRQVRDEASKITWTTRNETMISTIMVLIMVALASVFFLLVDQILRWIVPLILNINA